MQRRSFIAGVSCTILATSFAGPAAAQSDEAREMKALEQLVNLYRRLRDFGNVWADDITKLKLARFLNGVQDPLNEILHQKQSVLDLLAAGRCSGDEDLIMRLASKSAFRINELLGVLGEKMRILSTAIKPKGLREEAAALGDSLARLRHSKLWLEQIDRFCRMSDADRRAFLGQVRNSMALVERARNELNDLLDKLN